MGNWNQIDQAAELRGELWRAKSVRVDRILGAEIKGSHLPMRKMHSTSGGREKVNEMRSVKLNHGTLCMW